MKKIILIAIFTLFSISVMSKTANVKVNGMVCEFCVSTIQKNLYKNSNVKNVAIDFDTQNVKIDFKEGKSLTDAQITDIIVNNGFSVEKITR